MLLSRFRYLYFVIMLLPIIGGCSFSPMYGVNSNSQLIMSEIYVNDASDRNHQIVRNEILKYIGQNAEQGKSKLEMDFKIDIEKNPLLIDSSGEAKRMQLEVEVEYNIFRITEFRELIYSNSARVYNTFTLSSSEYNNAQAEISTYDLIAKEAASIINKQISLNHPKLMN
tara:strand:+ start:480 stop:989 length:510 start_codon:yes stop_codon:yes gene_type:complete